MELGPGARLGPYEILAHLGSGGMGEVWRARDPRLGREVALKVLPADVSHDEEWRARFQREARSAASFSHPHVCAVYDVGREGSRDYLVLELLEGETLAARLERGALPFPEVLRLGAQIAAGLAAAHASGLIHRDLKPGNVMLVGAGVKLLDFGLAKLVLGAEPAVPNTPGSTAGMGLSGAGAVLGTVPYMSPEQAAGRPVDARTDIFALGAVLYEMATGERAFPGQSQAEVFSAILTRDPPAISRLRPRTPAGFDRLVAGCLAKDPADRWDSAHDLSIRLRTPEVEIEPPAQGTSRAPRRGAVAAVLFLGMLLGAAGTLLIRPPAPAPEPASPVHLLQPPPSGTKFFQVPEVSSLAVSPDGKRIAFVVYRSGLASSGWMRPEGRQVWVRSLSEPEAHPVPFSEGATSVFWSPDGTVLGFVVPGAMKRVNLDGGIPVVVCPMGPGALASWGPDGNIVFTRLVEGPLFEVPAAGGEPRPLLQPDRSSGDTAYSWPVHLPNGWLLFLARREDGTYRLMIARPGEAPRPLMTVSSKVQFTEPGLLVFVRDGALLAQRFDLRSQKLVGEPWAIASHVSNFASNASAEFATSSGGTLVWQPADSVGALTWLDRAGHSLGRLGEDGSWRAVSISPDGEFVASSRGRPDTSVVELWSFDISRGIATPMAPNRFTETWPVWHPSGSQLVYSAAERGVPNLRRLDLTTGEVVELRPSGTFQIPQTFCPDGGTLVFTEREGNGEQRAYEMPFRPGAESKRLPFSDADTWSLRCSPDGHDLAYISSASGRGELYIARNDHPGSAVRVSRDGAVLARWSRGTHELIYLAPDRKVWSVPVSTDRALRAGVPALLFDSAQGLPWLDFDVSPDGQRILAVVPQFDADRSPLEVLVHWPSAAPAP